MRLRIEREIARPAKEVFDASADFAGSPERITGIVKVEMSTDGPVGVGTRFRETRVMFGREATETMEVAGFEPGRRYLLVAESCGCRDHSEVRVEPRGDAAVWSFEFNAQPLTRFAKVMSFLLRPMARLMVGACRKHADDLKRSLEQPSAASAGDQDGRA